MSAMRTHLDMASQLSKANIVIGKQKFTLENFKDISRKPSPIFIRSDIKPETLLERERKPK